MELTIIGIDCATDVQKAGLALAWVDGEDAWFEDFALGSRVPSVVDTIPAWATS